MPAFTLKAKKGILRVLVTEVQIHIANDLKSKEKINAIWDTGASGSAITSTVAAKLGLIPTGKANVNTANGQVTQSTYTVDIGLTNGALIKGVIVTEVSALSSGCDALIGMDIISLGDFSITNHNGTTCMSFRIPSQHEVDYVKNPTYGITPVVKAKSTDPFSNAKRNDPCPCGSGKKFKHCCIK